MNLVRPRMMNLKAILQGKAVSDANSFAQTRQRTTQDTDIQIQDDPSHPLSSIAQSSSSIPLESLQYQGKVASSPSMQTWCQWPEPGTNFQDLSRAQLHSTTHKESFQSSKHQPCDQWCGSAATHRGTSTVPSQHQVCCWSSHFDSPLQTHSSQSQWSWPATHSSAKC